MSRFPSALVVLACFAASVPVFAAPSPPLSGVQVTFVSNLSTSESISAGQLTTVNGYGGSQLSVTVKEFGQACIHNATFGGAAMTETSVTTISDSSNTIVAWLRVYRTNAAVSSGGNFQFSATSCNGGASFSTFLTVKSNAGPANNSCQTRCGGSAPSGCYCDFACELIGDCCADKINRCGAILTCASPETGTYCGTVGFMFRCYCDAECVQFGDCCPDVHQLCDPLP